MDEDKQEHWGRTGLKPLLGEGSLGAISRLPVEEHMFSVQHKERRRHPERVF